MNSLIDRWKKFSWYQKILVIPGAIVVTLFTILFMPIYLVGYIVELTGRLFEFDSVGDDSGGL